MNNNINGGEELQHNEIQGDDEMNDSDINRNKRNGQQQNDNNGVNETENNQDTRNKATTTPTINWTQQTIPQYDTTPNRQNKAWVIEHQQFTTNNIPSLFPKYQQTPI
jgi:hypothetical protein